MLYFSVDLNNKIVIIVNNNVNDLCIHIKCVVKYCTYTILYYY